MQVNTDFSSVPCLGIQYQTMQVVVVCSVGSWQQQAFSTFNPTSALAGLPELTLTKIYHKLDSVTENLFYSAIKENQ
jgi:hypothetical protein